MRVFLTSSSTFGFRRDVVHRRIPWQCTPQFYTSNFGRLLQPTSSFAPVFHGGVDRTRTYSTDNTGDVVRQLRRVRELQTRVAAENSKSVKQQIISEYPDLRELLEHVYHPNHRAHLSSSSLQTYLTSLQSSSSPPQFSEGPHPRTITELFDLLSRRTVTGNTAKDLVIKFLERNGIPLPNESLNKDEIQAQDFDTFGRLLDRNLVAGFGARTLREVKWSNDSQAVETLHLLSKEPTTTSANLSTSQAKTLYDPSSTSPNRDLTQMSAALGKSILPPFTDLYKSNSKWYASRKLDGVRCITYLDFLIPRHGASSPTLVDISFYSRSGKRFTTLEKVADRLRDIVDFPHLSEWLDRDPYEVNSRDDGQIKRLVLDGEICVLRERDFIWNSRDDTERSYREDDGTGVGHQGSTADLVEDFASTISEIRRLEYTVTHPVYFLFDILPYSMFDSHKSSLTSSRNTITARTFGQRIEDLYVLGDFLARYNGSDERGKIVRPLAQWDIRNSSEEVDKLVEKATKEGWEGLIFRADKPYKGTRSNDIRKFKQWQDGEYTVHRISVSRMRLSVGGVFDEYEALASVWIRHKGFEVSVGSGFTSEERLKFAKDPESIIGKEITVEYFSESKAQDREAGLSLRFPRVKHIWLEGKRSI